MMLVLFNVPGEFAPLSSSLIEHNASARYAINQHKTVVPAAIVTNPTRKREANHATRSCFGSGSAASSMTSISRLANSLSTSSIDTNVL